MGPFPTALLPERSRSTEAGVLYSLTTGEPVWKSEDYMDVVLEHLERHSKEFWFRVRYRPEGYVWAVRVLVYCPVILVGLSLIRSLF